MYRMHTYPGPDPLRAGVNRTRTIGETSSHQIPTKLWILKNAARDYATTIVTRARVIFFDCAPLRNFCTNLSCDTL